ncbi:Uncharacterised protein [Streptococcus pneumoniae]|nr:Uncharacterised protein [Streptococcus pneumoniae]CRF95881.1 Uncharacterised protein [Streptococcus pneumoniae]
MPSSVISTICIISAILFFTFGGASFFFLDKKPNSFVFFFFERSFFGFSFFCFFTFVSTFGFSSFFLLGTTFTISFGSESDSFTFFSLNRNAFFFGLSSCFGSSLSTSFSLNNAICDPSLIDRYQWRNMHLSFLAM